MNTYKKLALSIGVIGLVLSGLVGCAKGGGGSGNVSGNVSISGSTVSSSDTVNGQQMTVTISNIQTMGNSYYYGNSGSGTLSATLAINGQTGQLQTYVVTPSNYNGAQSSMVGNYTVYSMAECIDTACQNVGLVVWISSGNYYGSNGSQMKQIGVIDNLSNGTIRSAIEAVGYPSNSGMTPVLPAGPALITQMQSVMQ